MHYKPIPKDYVPPCERNEALIELEAYRATGLSPERVAELAWVKSEGRLLALPCTVSDLEIMFEMVILAREPDKRETYTSGYRSGHRNGRIELLRYILQRPDGASQEKGETS